MLELFDYSLPSELIANHPAQKRDHSRLMVVDRSTQTITDKHFYDLLDVLGPKDVLVLNQTKVFPARLYGHKTTGGKVEILLHQPQPNGAWSALSKPGLKTNQTVTFGDQLQAKVVSHTDDGQVILEFNQVGDRLQALIDQIGFTPLPPYIQTEDSNLFRERYQTVYARDLGSVAAPTAGLHFTPDLLKTLREHGVQIEYITLHVGLGTFKPVTEEQITAKHLHFETFEIDPETLNRLNSAKAEGKQITSVGTTTTRVLESCSDTNGILSVHANQTDLFIQPGDKFHFVNHLITNFHIPKSSLLMLVSAFTSFPQTSEKFVDFQTSQVGKAYNHAIAQKYHFYSFGDAMLII